MWTILKSVSSRLGGNASVTSSESRNRNFGRLFLVVAIVSAIPSIAGERSVSAAVPTWVPGMYWSKSMTGEGLSSPSVAYGKNRWIAVGGDSNGANTLIKSTDGKTWSVVKKNRFTITSYSISNGVQTFTTSAPHGFHVGENLILTNATTNTTLGMVDSTTQTAVTGTAFSITAVTSTTISFSIGNANVPDAATTSVNVSYDDSGNSIFKSVTFGGSAGNEKFVAVRDSSVARIWTSSDGDTWAPVPYNHTTQNGSWKSITYGGGKFVAVGQSGAIMRSSDDGATWAKLSTVGSQVWTSVTYGNGKFVAVGSGGTNRIAYSSDAVTWTVIPATTDTSSWNSVSFGNNTFVAVASTGTNRVMTSPDGVTWTASSVPGLATATWKSSISFGGTFVLGGDTNAVAYSTDNGVSWSIPPTAFLGGFNNTCICSMAYDGNLLVGLDSRPTPSVFYSEIPPAPTTTTLSPSSGTPAGGTSVTINGTYLRGATSVKIGGVAATITSATGDATSTATPGGTVVVTTPAGTVGSQPVVIETLGGTVSTTFTYAWPAPTISSAAGTGSATGGQTVTITGTNLSGATAVTIGTSSTDATANITPVSSFNVVSATSVTAVMPPRPCGQAATSVWFIRVTTPGGTTTGNSNYKFTYTAATAPTITSLSVNSGSTAGGTNTVLTGTNFHCVSAVKFGGSSGTNAQSFTATSLTSLSVVTPAQTAGGSDVYLVAEGGNVTSAGAFTFITPVIITASSHTVVEGDAVPNISGTPSISGVMRANEICTTTYTTSSPPGTYPTSCSGGSASGYLVSYVDGAVTVAAAPTTTTTTTTVAPTTTTPSSTTTSSTTTTTSAPNNQPVAVAGAPTLITPVIQSQLQADPGEANAVINGKVVPVETLKTNVEATPEQQRDVANKIVEEINDVLPKGTDNPLGVVETPEGAEITGLMTNPDDPSEPLNVPVEAVTLIKAGDSKVLISALNQTNLPAEVIGQGILQVTRGGLVAAQAYGLPGLETGEIVLMSTPRLLKSFVVDKNGSYAGQVPLPKNISFGSHTVVMATKNTKVSLGIKLVRTKLQFRIKRKIGTTLFKNRAGVVKTGGGKVRISATGRCRGNSKRIVMAAKPGGCYITVRQAAKGANKAIYYRFTVSVVKKPIKVKAKR